MRLGVVYDPMRDEMFSAERGHGARLNDNPIRASDVRRTGKKSAGYRLSVRCLGYGSRTTSRTLCILESSRRACGALAPQRWTASYVGAGRFDGFWELALKPWDIAAGGLIAEEAGAKVTNVKNLPDYLSSPQSVVAAAPGIHSQIIKDLIAA